MVTLDDIRDIARLYQSQELDDYRLAQARNVQLQAELTRAAAQFADSEIVEFSANWRWPTRPTYELTYLSPFSDLRHRRSKSQPYNGQPVFDRVKTQLKQRGEGRACWACGGQAIAHRHLGGEAKTLAAHQFWDFNVETRMAVLLGVHFVCYDCYSLSKPEAEWALYIDSFNLQKHLDQIEKFCSVNACTVVEMKAHIEYAKRLAECGKAIRQWCLDFSPVEDLLREAGYFA